MQNIKVLFKLIVIFYILTFYLAGAQRPQCLFSRALFTSSSPFSCLPAFSGAIKSSTSPIVSVSSVRIYFLLRLFRSVVASATLRSPAISLLIISCDIFSAPFLNWLTASRIEAGEELLGRWIRSQISVDWASISRALLSVLDLMGW